VGEKLRATPHQGQSGERIYVTLSSTKMKFRWVQPFPKSEWIRLHQECLGSRTASTFERSGRWQGVLQGGFATLRKHVHWTARVNDSDGIELVVRSDTPEPDWRFLLYVVLQSGMEVYEATFTPSTSFQTLRLPYASFEKTGCRNQPHVSCLTKGSQHFVSAIGIQARDPEIRWRPMPFVLVCESVRTFTYGAVRKDESKRQGQL